MQRHHPPTAPPHHPARISISGSVPFAVGGQPLHTAGSESWMRWPLDSDEGRPNDGDESEDLLRLASIHQRLQQPQRPPPS